MQVIVTERLTLEPQVAAHADEMFGVLSDPAIYEHENAPPRSIEWLRERFGKLENRMSADGREQWLNWVVRLRTSEPIGYVQATVFPTGRAAIAYVMSSRYWGRGLAREACKAMLSELAEGYSVHSAHAVFKRSNVRSRRLLERLGFAPASPEAYVGSDELLMTRSLSTGAKA
jgi:RimJ/RimL family protein N-acetyltransferase